MKTDSSAVLSISPRISRAQTINGPIYDTSSNNSAITWNANNNGGQRSRPHSVSVDSRNNPSTSIES